MLCVNLNDYQEHLNIHSSLWHALITISDMHGFQEHSEQQTHHARTQRVLTFTAMTEGGKVVLLSEWMRQKSFLPFSNGLECTGRMSVASRDLCSRR